MAMWPTASQVCWFFCSSCGNPKMNLHILLGVQEKGSIQLLPFSWMRWPTPKEGAFPLSSQEPRSPQKPVTAMPSWFTVATNRVVEEKLQYFTFFLHKWLESYSILCPLSTVDPLSRLLILVLLGYLIHKLLQFSCTCHFESGETGLRCWML